MLSCLWGATPLSIKIFEGHYGCDFCFLSTYAYCTCSEYLNMGREENDVVRISPVKMTVKRKFVIFVLSQKECVCVCVCGGGGDIRYSVTLSTKSVCGGTCPFCPPPNNTHELYTFSVWLYDVRHMVKDHSYNMNGNPLLPLHGLLCPIEGARCSSVVTAFAHLELFLVPASAPRLV